MSAHTIHYAFPAIHHTSGAPRTGARNPEVLARVSQIGLMLQMSNRGEDRRASILAEGILQRASMYVMNQAYSQPLAGAGGVGPWSAALLLLSLTQAADLLKYKAKEATHGR